MSTPQPVAAAAAKMIIGREHCLCCSPPVLLRAVPPGCELDDDGKVIAASEVLAWQHGGGTPYPGYTGP